MDMCLAHANCSVPFEYEKGEAGCDMRISMIGPFGLRPKGTMAVRALPMAKALVKRGHAVTLILPPWDFPQDAGRSFDDAGVKVENIALPRSWPLLFHLNTMRRLVGRALAFQPDVIHAGPIQRVAFIAALAQVRPLLSMSWGSDLLLEADQNPGWRWQAPG